MRPKNARCIAAIRTQELLMSLLALAPIAVVVLCIAGLVLVSPEPTARDKVNVEKKVGGDR